MTTDNTCGNYGVLLLLWSFKWLLEKRVPAPFNENRFYSTLGVVIDAEGAIYAWKPTSGRTTGFSVVLRSEKEYVIKPLSQGLAKLGYDTRAVRSLREEGRAMAITIAITIASRYAVKHTLSSSSSALSYRFVVRGLRFA